MSDSAMKRCGVALLWPERFPRGVLPQRSRRPESVQELIDAYGEARRKSHHRTVIVGAVLIARAIIGGAIIVYIGSTLMEGTDTPGTAPLVIGTRPNIGVASAELALIVDRIRPCGRRDKPRAAE